MEVTANVFMPNESTKEKFPDILANAQVILEDGTSKMCLNGITVVDGEKGVYLSLPARKDKNDVYRTDYSFMKTREGRKSELQYSIEDLVINAALKAINQGLDRITVTEEHETGLQGRFYVQDNLHLNHDANVHSAGVCSVSLALANGSIAMSSVSIVQGKENTMFASLPSQKYADKSTGEIKYQDSIMLSRNMKENLNRAVDGAYNKALYAERKQAQTKDAPAASQEKENKEAAKAVDSKEKSKPDATKTVAEKEKPVKKQSSKSR